MYRLVKSMMAEFSYFLEKYFNVTSAFWSILFISICSAIIFGVIIKAINCIYNKKRDKSLNFFAFYLAISTVISYIVNRLMLVPQTWISKLHRVMSNLEYVLSFPTNNEAFFDGIMVPANLYNQKEVFRIAMYLNDNQWNNVFDKANGGSWYFEKVHKAISEILMIGNTNMSLGVLYQGVITSIPFIFIIGLAMFLLYKKKKLSALIVALSALIGSMFTFGGAICLCFSIYSALFCWYLLNLSEKQIKKNNCNRSIQEKENIESDSADSKKLHFKKM